MKKKSIILPIIILFFSINIFSQDYTQNSTSSNNRTTKAAPRLLYEPKNYLSPEFSCSFGYFETPFLSPPPIRIIGGCFLGGLAYNRRVTNFFHLAVGINYGTFFWSDFALFIVPIYAGIRFYSLNNNESPILLIDYGYVISNAFNYSFRIGLGIKQLTKKYSRIISFLGLYQHVGFPGKNRLAQGGGLLIIITIPINRNKYFRDRISA